MYVHRTNSQPVGHHKFKTACMYTEQMENDLKFLSKSKQAKSYKPAWLLWVQIKKNKLKLCCLLLCMFFTRPTLHLPSALVHLHWFSTLLSSEFFYLKSLAQQWGTRMRPSVALTDFCGGTNEDLVVNKTCHGELLVCFVSTRCIPKKTETDMFINTSCFFGQMLQMEVSVSIVS